MASLANTLSSQPPTDSLNSLAISETIPKYALPLCAKLRHISLPDKVLKIISDYAIEEPPPSLTEKDVAILRPRVFKELKKELDNGAREELRQGITWVCDRTIESYTETQLCYPEFSENPVLFQRLLHDPSSGIRVSNTKTGATPYRDYLVASIIATVIREVRNSSQNDPPTTALAEKLTQLSAFASSWIEMQHLKLPKPPLQCTVKEYIGTVHNYFDRDVRQLNSQRSLS